MVPPDADKKYYIPLVTGQKLGQVGEGEGEGEGNYENERGVVKSF